MIKIAVDLCDESYTSCRAPKIRVIVFEEEFEEGYWAVQDIFEYDHDEIDLVEARLAELLRTCEPQTHTRCEEVSVYHDGTILTIHTGRFDMRPFVAPVIRAAWSTWAATIDSSVLIEHEEKAA